MFKFILTGIFWGSIIMLAVPTTLILASWNAVPGDFTYNVKVGLEKVMLGVAPSPNLKSTLQIKYTERRFDEVEKVLATDYAHESLNNFNNQLIASKESIKQIESTEEKNIQTQNLINTLETVSQKIEQKQIAQVNYIIPTATSKPLSTPIPVVIKTVTVAMPTQLPPTAAPTSTPIPIPTNPPSLPPTNPDIPKELEETKEKIKKIIEELQKTQNQKINQPDNFEPNYFRSSDNKPDNNKSDDNKPKDDSPDDFKPINQKRNNFRK